MSIIGSNILAGASGNQGYEIARSLRFNDDDTAYLSRTPSSAGNRKTWTWSGWVKRGAVATASMNLFAVRTAASNRTLIRIRSHALDILDNDTNFQLTTTAVFRDPSAWYHFVVVLDTTESTSSDRLKIYVNGDQVTDFSTSSYPSLNYEAAINQTNLHALGREGGSSNDYFDGYMAEVNFVDGTALGPSDFGETDSVTGAWIPKKYSGSYGSQGWYLNFSDNSGVTATTLGKDSSGNSNNWTPNNFSVTAGTGNDSLEDTPTNNFCTMNPLNIGSSYLSDGNLKHTGSGWSSTSGTIAVSTGKWYWEVTSAVFGGSNYQQLGIVASTRTLGAIEPGTLSDAYVYSNNGNKYNNTTGASYGATFTTNDVIGVALDLDAGTLTFYKNGASQGTAYSSLSGSFTPCLGCFTGGVLVTNFGQRPFSYTAPSGFEAVLNTANAPVPTIKNGTEYFNTVVWSGDGSSPRAITGVGFQPDLIWTKPRSTGDDHLLMDVIRGTGNLKWLATNSSSAEGIAYNNANVTSLDSDGFTVGTTGGTNQLNATSRSPVAWNWKAGGSGSANTDGTISSTVSVNADAGFSIGTFSGTGSAGSIGHGLGIAPKWILIKNRDSSTSWAVYHDAAGANKQLLLNSSNGISNDTNGFPSAPTSTVINVGTGASMDTNQSGSHVFYAFAEVEGYSKFGSYEGNGSSDGTFIALPFKPAFFLLKDIDRASTRWIIMDNVRDPHNVAYHVLSPNGAQAEDASTSYWLADFVSNGVKLRYGADNEFNRSGDTYIYMAFAEMPFKYANAA